jgi:hypothetical protein
MAKKAIIKEDGKLLTDNLDDHCLRTAEGDGGYPARPRAGASVDGTNQNTLAQAPGARRAAADPGPPSKGIAGSDPGIENPEIFFDLGRMNLAASRLSTQSPRRKDVDREKDADPFHDSETDIHDLFNACNGVVRVDGLLDVSKLDEYSPQDSEALNVPRLREIWHHTESGCQRCARIIRTLRMFRERLRAGAEGSSEKRSDVPDVDAIDSAS